MRWIRTRPERKKRHLRRQVQHLPARCLVLAEDETDVLLFPPLRAGWAPLGRQVQVSITGRNARRVIFGTINLRTGHRVLLCREHGRAADFCAFLAELRRRYRDRPLALLLDEDPCHTAKISQHLASRLDIRLLWLPHRCPELNPMEHLWRFAKQQASANFQYRTIEAHVSRFMGYVQQLPGHPALRKAGVRSRRFWLRGALSKFFCGGT
jgi:transposase